MAKPTTFHDYTCVVTDIDRKQHGQRIVPMRVLSLGLPRTATECQSPSPGQSPLEEARD